MLRRTLLVILLLLAIPLVIAQTKAQWGPPQVEVFTLNADSWNVGSDDNRCTNVYTGVNASSLACSANFFYWYKYDGFPTLWKVECLIGVDSNSAATEPIDFKSYWSEANNYTAGSTVAAVFNGNTVSDGDKVTAVFNDVAPYEDGAVTIVLDANPASTGGSYDIICRGFLIP